MEVRSWEKVFWMTPAHPPHFADDEDMSNLMRPPGDDVRTSGSETHLRAPSSSLICRESPLRSSSLKTRSPPPVLLMESSLEEMISPDASSNHTSALLLSTLLLSSLLFSRSPPHPFLLFFPSLSLYIWRPFLSDLLSTLFPIHTK